MVKIKTPHFLLFSACASVLLAGCSGNVQPEAKYPTGADRSATGSNDIYESAPSIFGSGGILGEGGILGSKKDSNSDSITVNSYLWRASLDTLSFMPISSADPFGGTILTDWYTAPETPSERIKLNVFVLGKELAASNIKVNIFKQVRSGSGWQDAPASAETGRKLEDAILTRARQYRIAEDSK
tara:strand:+ start:1706 stop:2257 length:552 start_codon:yes stop_codon:yes gene_type:complete